MNKTWENAEHSSFDLEKRIVLISFPDGRKTQLPFAYIKNLYP